MSHLRNVPLKIYNRFCCWNLLKSRLKNWCEGVYKFNKDSVLIFESWFDDAYNPQITMKEIIHTKGNLRFWNLFYSNDLNMKCNVRLIANNGTTGSIKQNETYINFSFWMLFYVFIEFMNLQFSKIVRVSGKFKLKVWQTMWPLTNIQMLPSHKLIFNHVTVQVHRYILQLKTIHE